MQLTILGGAGLRTPLFIHGLVRARQNVHFDKVVLFDTDEERISLLGELNRFLVRRAGSPFDIAYTTDLAEAVRGADFIFSAIRVGKDEGRIADERIALKHGVLGQETTGPGGFAMALRTIPVLLDYAHVIERVAPDAWLLNFSNPAGLMTQALHDYSRVKVVGICDSPSDLGRRIAAFLNTDHQRMEMDYFGLNHLGWVRHIWAEGRDHLPYLLQHYEELAQTSGEFACFHPNLVRNIGMIPNEYLYYFYYQIESVKNILSSGQTRGEQIKALNDELMTSLRELIPQKKMEQAFDVYTSILGTRSSTYMARETTGQVREHTGSGDDVLIGGYEEVALRVIRGLTTEDTQSLIVNVPNSGAMRGLKDSDVVEVSCTVTPSGVRPLAVGEVPAAAEPWITAVKTYERYTVEAAVKGDLQAAVNALTIHPLVPSYRMAEELVHDYLAAHRPYLPNFA